MKKYERIADIPAEEKERLFSALGKAKNREEALQAFSDAGISADNKDIAAFLCNDNEKRIELNDDELFSIAGGNFYELQKSDSESDVTFIASVGMTVEVASTMLKIFGATIRCTVTAVRAGFTKETGATGYGSFTQSYYADEYYVVPLEDSFFFEARWVTREAIQLP